MNESANVQRTSFTIAVPTVYGQMLINRYDTSLGHALLTTGISPEHDEIVLLSELLPLRGTDLVAIDVGTNFGVFTLGLLDAVGPNGKIYSFEPQRIIFNMLAGTVALNSIENVYCYNMAVGDVDGMIELPQFDYSQSLNFGGVEFGGEQKEPLAQTRGHDPLRQEFVPITTLDRFSFARADLIKIDAEGMEVQVLYGAQDTIRRWRPIIYVEFLKADRLRLYETLVALDYQIYEYKINHLCIPSELVTRVPQTVLARVSRGQCG